MSQLTNFASLGLAQPLLRALTDAGYAEPTPVQAQAIPLVLEGRDLLAAAQTGTGKTAGFTLPILQRLEQQRADVRPGQPRCLILTPTRELAAQVEESVQTYGKYVSAKSMVMFGGVGMNPQVEQLKKRIDILVATPGRLLDHCGQKTLDLSRIEIFVLDEADRMLDMGFIRDIRRVLALLPAKRQNLLFSATFSDEIRALADGLLHSPASVEVARRNAASELVQQTVHLVPQEHKRDVLAHLIRQHGWRQVLVFTRTKHGANRLAEKLDKDGIRAAAIHGNKSQGARTRALAQFKDGSVPVLVATDIAARGLDIEELPHVVNFELPHVAEDYVHRIGRTGRAGSTGEAVSLVDREEMPLLAGIEKLLKRGIERVNVEGFEPQARPAQHERPVHHAQQRHAEERGQPRKRGRGNREPQGGRSEESRRSDGQNSESRRSDGRTAEGRRNDGRNADGRRSDGRNADGRRNDGRSADGRRSDGRNPEGRRNDGQNAAGRKGEHHHPHHPARGTAPATRHDENPGNAAKPRNPQAEQSTAHMSEAARHQAQPQPALFSPPPAPRRRFGNGNR